MLVEAPRVGGAHSMLEPEDRTVARAAPAHDPLQFERLLAELSARFINLPAAQVDAAITDALRRIVELLGVDRSQLVRFRSEIGQADVTHSWAAPGLRAVAPQALAHAYPWAIRRVQGDQPVVFARLDDLPPEATVDKTFWQKAGLKSHLVMPLSVAGQIEGAIALDCMRHERTWPEDLVERVRVLSTIFGNALAHKRAQESLEAAMAFERTVSGLLAALLTATPSEQDRVIDAGLRDTARLLGAEHAALWQRPGGKIAFAQTHGWLAEGVPALPDRAGAIELPWISAQLAAGSRVRFGCQPDLPAEAATDLATLRALGVQAAIILPFSVSGSVVGALSYATTREERDWPGALLARVQLIGEVFASVLAREEAQRREQEAQAQAAHAARVGTMGVFAASLVHELTQPLAASLANAETASELLAARSPDLDELRATVADMVADDRRASELVQQLRRFLRRGEVERVGLRLQEVVDEVLRLIGVDAAEKGIALTVDLPQALPEVLGDRVQLEQVLLNLLLNGIDAAAASEPGSRRIELVARPSSAGVRIAVSDSGPGMDEQMLARIFQPFFTTKPGGMGLGLAISRTIVAAHGGTLSVESARGRGTTFRIDLPLHPPHELRTEQPRAVPCAEAAGSVFVIDDEPSMRQALERQLEGVGYRVQTYASAQGFLEQIPQADVACIVSDIRMPGMSGLDLQASLARAGRELPMVFISGHGDIPTTVHAMKAGAVSLLSKPFTRSELLAAIADALARSRERARARAENAELQARCRLLTPREREVFALVAAGLLNKVIADRLGAAETTIKIHRGRVMEKMGAASLADLVRMAGRLNLVRPGPGSR
jgi:FixJ family two-component response regulator/signal transduction histidine kinase